MKKSINHIYLIILLSILSSVAPMGVDTYLPSMPEIAESLNVSIHKIELSLSIFLIGFSIGQIFGGPISDRYGRKMSSVYGLLGFAFFSFIIIFSTSIYELWIYRFIEAMFGGIVVVNAAAAVRDRFHGEEAAKVFSLIGIVRSLAPLLAPVIGAFIIHFFTWKAVFVFLTLYALVVTFFVYKDLEESYTYKKQNIIESFKIVLRDINALKTMVTLGFAFGGFFSVIAKTSFIYIEYFKIPTDYFPLFFGINFILLMILMKVNISLLNRYHPIALVKSAILVQIVAGTLFTFSYANISLLTTVILVACYMGMMAFIFGNTMALALENFSNNAGVASSVIGVLQFGLGALVSSIALSFHDGTLLPVGASVTVISVLSFFIIRTYKRV
jgi:DHA1 family bicyclomycin/chloramphenicol resistance-like MFS transporter